MKRTLCVAAALLAAGVASAEIVIIQAEDAVTLGSNYVVVADTNVPPYAFETNYITPLTTDTAPSSMSVAIYAVGNLTSNALYDLYMRVHVGPGGYSDDSCFVNTAGFGTNTLSFSFQNGIAGRTGLDGQGCQSPGFHWIKMNGTGDLGFLGAFNAGAGTNLYYAIAAREDGLDVDALAFVTADLPVTDDMLNPANATVEVWSLGGIPDSDTPDPTPLIEAYFLDGAGTVDAIAMSVDGNSVSNYSTTYSNFITTVSYTPSVPLELDTTHTASVVATTAPGGLYVTNAFSFYVGYPISYVDVASNNTVMASTNDGPVGAGTTLVTTTNRFAINGMWAWRTDFGNAPSVTNEPTQATYPVPYSGANTVMESLAGDNCPRLKTSAYVQETGYYNVYAYLWDNGGGWDLRAGLEDTPGTNTLPLITNTSSNIVEILSVGPDFWGTHRFYRVKLGTVEIADTNTPIVVYHEDAPGSGDRTWVDGIGFQPLAVAVPTLNPDIQSFSIAGGTATFTWTSEVVGTYKIMHKTNVTDAVWTPVKSGIGGGDPTTTDSVSLSGASQEFFRIEGN